MRIAKLYMDPQDKQRFEIQGKSSVKYHLKANHQVEAKRWYWALNNAIQWAKDEAREEEKRSTLDQEALKQAKIEQIKGEGDASSLTSSRMAASRNLAPCKLSPTPNRFIADLFDSKQPRCPSDTSRCFVFTNCCQCNRRPRECV